MSQDIEPPIKVVNIVEEGRFGGPHKRIIEVAKGLQEYNIHTTVILPRHDSESCVDRLNDSQTPFVTLPLHRLTRDPWHLFLYLLLFPWEVWLLFRQIRKLKPDVVHCNGSYQVKGVLAAWLSRTRSVWHMNDTFAPGIVLRLFRFVSWLASDRFIAASHRTAKYYFPATAESIPVIPAPIQTSHFCKDQVQPDPTVEKLEGIRVVTVGNINPVKGYRTLLSAIHEINQSRREGIHFLAVGRLLENQTRYIDELRQFQTEHELSNFQFWGASNQVREILAAADLYVCCSDFESSPISVWEAMSMSLPVVSTDVGDVRQWMERADCGVVVPAGDARSLARAILEMVNRTDREDLGQRGRMAAVEHLDTRNCIRKHADLYRETAKKR